MKDKQKYRGNGAHSWELVTESGKGSDQSATYRLRVPGGWLYADEGGASTFVPMPEVVKYEV